MPFERFTEGGKGHRPKVSIRSNGQIGLNYGAVKKFRLDKYKFAVLFYDKDRKVIGIKLTNDEKENGVYKLQTRQKSSSVSARSFVEYYDIDYSKTSRYDAKLDEKENMILVELQLQTS